MDLPPAGRFAAIETPDGARLRTAWWSATGVRGTVLLLHGRTEFIEKYAEVIGELGERGFAVWTFDWRGQGLSERHPTRPLAGHIDDFATYLDDLDFALAQTLPAASGPRILLGHSMGGHLAVRALAERRLAVAAAILSAPMLRIALRRHQELASNLLGRLFTVLGGGRRYVPGQRDFDPVRAGFEGNLLTGDAVRFRRTAACTEARPELRLGGVTWGWLDAARRSSAALDRPEVAAAIDVPVLVLQGAADRVVDNRAMATLAARLPRGRLARLEDARHEPFIETDAIRARLWWEVDAFLTGVLDPA